METRRAILSALGSDLVLKDKILSINTEKSLFPIKRITKDISAIRERLEPLNTVEKQNEFDRLCVQNPRRLRGLDSNQDESLQRRLSYH